ncbi:hypothetical protein F8M49_21050 [Rhodococcus zopfii]|uniref:Uncharacterized protein n=1 Tax=Rhodococcus zopfii TaxID=43772 RepID=A0ABU3WT92_9NOCA|nr:hypothetical protein [Rhodococcus zopfii]
MSSNLSVGAPTITIDGNTYTIPELIARVRNTTPLTHDDIRTIVREELQVSPAIGELHDLLQIRNSTLDISNRPTSVDCNLEQGIDQRSATLKNLREGLIGILQELSSDRLVSGQRSQSLSKTGVLHETSPSADDVGAHSVGDRPAVGVRTWPPQPTASTGQGGVSS